MFSRKFAEYVLDSSKKPKARYDELSSLVEMPETMAHASLFSKLMRERSGLEKIAENHDELERALSDPNTSEEHLLSISEQLNGLLRDRYVSGGKNALLTVEAGDGCAEAAEFAQSVLKMYGNYFRLSGSDFSVIAKNSIFVTDAYDMLSHEAGVHKKAGKKNIYANVTVLPEKPADTFDFSEKDVKIDLFHSGGAGGQNVNKVETAVRARHIPTGITVTCQDERSQLKNKTRAIEGLRQRVFEYIKAEAEKSYEKECLKCRKACKKAGIVRVYDFSAGTVTDTGSGLAEKLDWVLSGHIQRLADTLRLKGMKE